MRSLQVGIVRPNAALVAAKASDLIPCRPAILDLEAVSTSFDLVRTTGVPAFVVLNGVAPRGVEADANVFCTRVHVCNHERIKGDSTERASG